LQNEEVHLSSNTTGVAGWIYEDENPAAVSSQYHLLCGVVVLAGIFAVGASDLQSKLKPNKRDNSGTQGGGFGVACL